MIGYAGTGYKGMQVNVHGKTIEGDLFTALVAAGAVSKANADDPKKSALVRCARTDKGVHAAGNVLSMKLIVQDGEEDVVQKINDNLPEQIRVYGIKRTNKSFNAYHVVSSRIYEYLIPTHCFLPPHPRTFLGRMLHEIAEEEGDMEGYQKRQDEVADFWQRAEEEYIKPALEGIDEELREEALRAVFEGYTAKEQAVEDTDVKTEAGLAEVPVLPATETSTAQADVANASTEPSSTPQDECKTEDPSIPPKLYEAMRTIRAAIFSAKLAYRIPASRLARVHATLALFGGTHNFHNYTVRKEPRDPSARRHMKSVTAAGAPIERGGGEWLALRVHGQSFMMHQIRKMVGLAALAARGGADPSRLVPASLRAEPRLAVPKAPGVGLLLERPVFDAYNERIRREAKNEREDIGFHRFEATMDAFKHREIYPRVFTQESQLAFHQLFAALDLFRSPQLRYLSSAGVEAVGRKIEGASAAWEAEVGLNKGHSLEAVEGEDEEDAENGEG